MIPTPVSFLLQNFFYPFCLYNLLKITDRLNKPENSTKFRYIPIEVEPGHPSTSTPNESGKYARRIRTVPIQLVEARENGDDVPSLKSRSHIPANNVVHVIDDDSEVSLDICIHNIMFPSSQVFICYLHDIELRV